MTETEQNNPGTLVMYKLKEENVWWPAILYPSHIVAQRFMTAENYSSDYHKEIISQVFKELSPKHPCKCKPVVCVLGHPNKPAEKPWWYPVDENEKTKPLTVSNISDQFIATPEAFQDALYKTLNGVVAEKMAANAYQIAEVSPSGEALPNVSPDTGRGPTRAAVASQNDSQASSLPIEPCSDTTNNQTKKHVDTHSNAAPLPNDRANSPAMEAPMEDEPLYEKAPFDIHASFADAWDKLEDEGWYEHRSNKDWNMYYSQPHELGGRHFLRHELEAHLRDTYGWSPSDEEEDRGSVVTTPDRRTKPQDPGQPLPESPDVSDGPLTVATLEREGWKVVKGGLLQNYLYLKPGVKKGEGEEGIDFFTNLQDAFDCYLAEVEDTRSYHSKPSVSNAKPRRLDLDDEMSFDETSSYEMSSKKSAKKKTASSSYRRVSDVSTASKQEQKRSKSKDRKSLEVEKKGRPNDQKAKKQKSQTGKTTVFKQKSVSVPITLLQKVGFQLVDETFLIFKFSESLSSKFSFVGLPVFLARYGIPNANKLNAKELETIISWIRSANIPKATPSQLLQSENLSSKEIKDILVALNFEVLSGAIYIPNVPRERVYGVHYFHADRLHDVRSFLGWALDYASMFEDLGDSKGEKARKEVDYLYFVSKIKVNTPKHSLFTKLRLWAATNDAPLPSFSARKLDVGFMEALIDPKIRVSFTNVIEDNSPLIDSASDEDEGQSPRPVAKQPKPSNAEKTKKFTPAWHEAYTGGQSNSAILELLRKLGFQGKGNHSISHPSIGERRFSLEEIRRYMVLNHIVDFEKKKSDLNKLDLQTLHRWCAYINLDHEVFLPYLSNAKVQVETKIVKILQTLGFGCVSGDYYLPGADKNRLTRTSYSMSQLFEYCRSHEVWSINDSEEVGIHSYKKFGVELSDWVDMLLTMARVDEQILAFKTPSKHEGRSKRRREIMTAIEYPSLVPTKAKKSRKVSLECEEIPPKTTLEQEQSSRTEMDISNADGAEMETEQQNALETNPPEPMAPSTDHAGATQPVTQEQCEDTPMAIAPEKSFEDLDFMGFSDEEEAGEKFVDAHSDYLLTQNSP